MRWVAVEGGSLHVEEQGSGPAVILLHGWSLDARMWTRQFGRMTDKYRLIAPDRRGFGHSTAPPGLGLEIQDILDLMEQFQLDTCVLWGMSQGGRIAQRFAVDHSERLAGLILQSAPMDGIPPASGSEAIPVEKFTSLVKAGNLAELRRQWLEHPIMRCSDEPSPSVLASMIASYDARDLNASGNPGTACADLSTVDVPALVTVGARETNWLRSTAQTIAQGLAKSRLETIEGAGHFSNLTHPEIYEGWLSILSETSH